jgi:hypothetical protein
VTAGLSGEPPQVSVPDAETEPQEPAAQKKSLAEHDPPPKLSPVSAQKSVPHEIGTQIPF